jgi:hypothetical protein
MADIVLYSSDERRCTEQIRLMIAETGLKFEEKVVSAAEEQQMAKEGKLMYGKLPMLKVAGFMLNEGASPRSRHSLLWMFWGVLIGLILDFGLLADLPARRARHHGAHRRQGRPA